MIIDAHQHFWQLDRGDYGWLTADLTPLYRDFLPEDFTPLIQECGVQKSILVQAAPTVAETKFLFRLAEENDFIAGVVGWVDFESRDAVAQIEELAAQEHLVGLRPMIQDIPDPDWMLKSSLTKAFVRMVELGLVFDALVLPIHLPNLRILLDHHPDLQVVIDHAAKPTIADGIADTWFEDIDTLASLPNVCCKVSGLVTEASGDWKPDDLHPVINHLLDSFGPRRLLWGSDWPVLNLASQYGEWFRIASEALSHLYPSETAAVFGGNAERIYLNRSTTNRHA